MELKTGYKQTEVGVIPSDWEAKELSKLCLKLNVGFVGICEPFFTNEATGTLLIRTGNLQGNNLVLEGSKYVTWDFHTRNKKSQVNSGDILIARHGSSGNAVMVPDYIKEANTLNIVIIKIDEKITSSRYSVFAINSTAVRNQVVNLTAGSTQGVINTSSIAKLLIPLPPTKAEQTAIATALSDTDQYITHLEKLIAKKWNIKQGAMQELLKPKEGWVVKKIFQLADCKKELFDDGDWIEAEHITDEGIRLIQTGNIGVGSYVEKDTRKYIFKQSFEKLGCKELQIGDLLICRLAEPAGRACVLPNIGEEKVITSVDVTIFRPRAEVANRIFLSYIFSTDLWLKAVSEMCGGTTHKRISRSALGKIEISVPNILEQNRIATILGDMDGEINTLQTKLSKAQSIKQGMMQQLLTGKIRLI